MARQTGKADVVKGMDNVGIGSQETERRSQSSLMSIRRLDPGDVIIYVSPS